MPGSSCPEFDAMSVVLVESNLAARLGLRLKVADERTPPGGWD